MYNKKLSLMNLGNFEFFASQCPKKGLCIEYYEDEFHNDLQISRENGVLSWHLNEDLVFQANEREILYEHEVAAKLEFVPVGDPIFET